jgi:hypothetical protein
LITFQRGRMRYDMDAVISSIKIKIMMAGGGRVPRGTRPREPDCKKAGLGCGAAPASEANTVPRQAEFHGTCGYLPLSRNQPQAFLAVASGLFLARPVSKVQARRTTIGIPPAHHVLDADDESVPYHHHYQPRSKEEGTTDSRSMSGSVGDGWECVCRIQLRERYEPTE